MVFFNVWLILKNKFRGYDNQHVHFSPTLGKNGYAICVDMAVVCFLFYQTLLNFTYLLPSIADGLRIVWRYQRGNEKKENRQTI